MVVRLFPRSLLPRPFAAPGEAPCCECHASHPDCAAAVPEG